MKLNYTLKDFAETLTICILAAGLSITGVAFVLGGIYILMTGLSLFTLSLGMALVIDHKEVVALRSREVL